MLQSYRGLLDWQKSIELVEKVYSVTKRFPKTEMFGLSTQMQRAATSIPSNIAEGYGRSHRAEYLQHLSYARGSLCELETQLVIAARLNYVDRIALVPVWRQTQSVGQLLNKHIASLKSPNRPFPGPRNPKPGTRVNP